jgi:release factor glutamine methyltransferase
MGFKTVKQILASFEQELHATYTKQEIRSFVQLLLEFKIGFSKVDMLMKENDTLEENVQVFCKTALQKLKVHEPIQYIIGETQFYGLTFKVNKNVLVPRPETEELVHWIIEDNTQPNPLILDIGTGSGCIPVSLKKNIKEAQVFAWDISNEALQIATENALLNKVEVNFSQKDILTLSDYPEHKFDVIVSNPPYIRNLEKEMMQLNVLAHEPHLALFVDDSDPLIFYRTISAIALKLLKPNGMLYFEINEAFATETKDLMESLGYNNVEVRKDLFGKDRMVKGCLL